MNNVIKSPEEIQRIQEAYATEVETQLLDSLSEQFNTLMSQKRPGKSIYVIKMYMYRPAGFYNTANVKARFIARCTSAGWLVSNAVINECQFTITVSPLR